MIHRKLARRRVRLRALLVTIGGIYGCEGSTAEGPEGGGGSQADGGSGGSNDAGDGGGGDAGSGNGGSGSGGESGSGAGGDGANGGSDGSGGSSGSGGNAGTGATGGTGGGTGGTGGGSGDGGSSGDGGTSGEGGSGGGPGDTCDVFGDTREIPCGNCGKQLQTCTSSGVWSNVGSCDGQKECAAGSTETRSPEQCVEEQRACSDMCAWGEWHTTKTAECTPGEKGYDNTGCAPGLLKKATCDAQCQWVNPGACANHCTGTPRKTPAWSEEVCVPSGEFVRGDEEFDDAKPVARVFLSAYYMDRFPVTKGRYRECVSAGECPEPISDTFRWTDSSRDPYPMQGVPRAAMLAFCEWDDRTLTTEAQWEKAARGPAPRWTKFLWGDDPDCDPATVENCPPVNVEIDGNLAPYAYDAFTKATGFYGGEHMTASWIEMVLDYYDPAYYADPTSLADPAGPASADFFTTRSYGPRSETRYPIGARYRLSVLGEQSFPLSKTFRCVRGTADAAAGSQNHMENQRSSSGGYDVD